MQAIASKEGSTWVTNVHSKNKLPRRPLLSFSISKNQKMQYLVFCNIHQSWSVNINSSINQGMTTASSDTTYRLIILNSKHFVTILWEQSKIQLGDQRLLKEQDYTVPIFCLHEFFKQYWEKMQNLLYTVPIFLALEFKEQCWEKISNKKQNQTHEFITIGIRNVKNQFFLTKIHTHLHQHSMIDCWWSINIDDQSTTASSPYLQATVIIWLMKKINVNATIAGLWRKRKCWSKVNWVTAAGKKLIWSFCVWSINPLQA